MDMMTVSQRYRAMAHNRGRTRPERALASGLWRRGHRCLTHDGYRSISGKRLTGKPDLVFSRKRVVIFFDGCFWHGCLSCGKNPEQSGEFWAEKIATNRRRDEQVTAALETEDWTVLRIPEHDLRTKSALDKTAERVSALLNARHSRDASNNQAGQVWR